MGSNLTLYAAGTGGTENNVALIQVPRNGRLVGVQFMVEADFDADGEYHVCQVSFRDVFSAANDTQYLIAGVTRRHFGAIAAGAGVDGQNHFVPLDLPVAMMERIYMNLSATAAVVSTNMAILQFDFDMVTNRRLG